MTTESLLAAVPARDPSEDELDAVVASMLEDRVARFVLRAPDRVDLSREASLPLLAFTANRTDAGLPLKRRGVIVATRLESNTAHAALWSEWKDRTDIAPNAPPDPDEPVGFEAEPLFADARERLPDLPWRPAHLVVRAVVGDRVTDAARVELTQGAVADDPEVRDYLERMGAQERAPTPALYPFPMDAQRDELTPEVPIDRGIALAIPRASLTRKGDYLVLRGAYNLPINPDEVIAATAPDAFDAEGNRIVARVVITLLIVGHDSPGPSLITLRVEPRVFANPHADGRMGVAGIFRCELLAHPAMPRVLQRYSLYALSGEQFAGPAPFTLLNEALVPLPDR